MTRNSSDVMAYWIARTGNMVALHYENLGSSDTLWGPSIRRGPFAWWRCRLAVWRHRQAWCGCLPVELRTR